MVSTIPELHFFVEKGFDDIIYALPIQYNRLDTIATYLEQGKDVKIVVDHPQQFDFILQYAEKHREKVKRNPFKVGMV